MRSKYSIIFFLVVLTLAVYWRAGNNQFVIYDDPGYVTENPHVLTGFTLENIRWAFTTTQMANWNPLTWLSHMADCQLYGANPRGHHFTSVLIHIANTVLLFLILARMTGALWWSAYVAALFALHPLHVESVAWVAERKDVLSTLFFLLAILMYCRYVERRGPVRYLPILLAYALGLMAKPMLVTFPFILLLLDYWPLGRYQLNAPTDIPASPVRLSVVQLIMEKIPLFTLSAVFSFIAIHAQSREGAMMPVTAVPINIRVANALVSYVHYLVKMVWPENLAVLYPFPKQVPLWQVGGALLVLGGISLLVFRRMRRSPYLPVGWLWFLGTLVPVIGLVQVGNQAMADRYTYIPLIGIFIMIVWGAAEITAGWRYGRLLLSFLAVVIISLLSAGTWLRLGVWANSVDLFTQTVAVTRDNSVARLNLGYALDEKGRSDEALAQFAEVLRINPNSDAAHGDMANVLSKKGRVDEAIAHYKMALRLNPRDALVHKNLGINLLAQGKTDEAVAQFSEALRLKPDDQDAHFNMGIALAKMGRFQESVSHFSFVLQANPYDIEARNRLENSLAEIRKAQNGAKR